MSKARLTPEEQRRELDRLRDLAAAKIRRMPDEYQNWGTVRTRAYVKKLEVLTRMSASVDKRLTRVIARTRTTLASLENIATTSDVAALAKSLGAKDGTAQA